MATKWQRFTVEIPKGLSPMERELIGEEILELIRERTKSGVDWHGNAFPGYSRSYKESLEFEIAGKSPNEVNLTLSGDTLAALTVLKSTDGKLVIGFERGSQENAIADGNIRGTYGNPEPVAKPRDFLGIRPEELEGILENFDPRDALIHQIAKNAVTPKPDTILSDEGDDG